MAAENRAGCCTAYVGSWHETAEVGRAEHVRSARVIQTSTCSAMVRASSTSIPRYLTVLSILVWPSRSCTALKLPMRRSTNNGRLRAADDNTSEKDKNAAGHDLK